MALPEVSSMFFFFSLLKVFFSPTWQVFPLQDGSEDRGTDCKAI